MIGSRDITNEHSVIIMTETKRHIMYNKVWMLPALSLKYKVVLKIESNAWKILRIVYFGTNREALTVLCFKG